MTRAGSDPSANSELPTHLATTPPPESDPPTAATVRLGGPPAFPSTAEHPLVVSVTGSHVRHQKPPEVPGFEVQGELGRGGMGVVYRAVQAKLNRLVALKMLRADDADDPAEVVRFRSEAEAVAAVRHPHVVQVYAYGLHDGRPYFAMEHLPGGTLHARLRADAPFPPERAAELLEKLAGAVHAAHQQGIVHRDIKPGNVLFDAAGEPRVTDFGLAKRAACDLTRTQAVMGTPAYMPPEQAAGRAKFAGPPADIYALGVILYECLTGATPFHDDDSLVLLNRVIHEAPPPPRSKVHTLPRDLELICLKCLEKEPHDRYHTAAALADDLRRFRHREPVSVRPASLVERAVKWARRRPTAAAAYGLAGLAAVLALFGGGLAVQWRRAAVARDVANEHWRQVEQARGDLERKNGELELARGELERKNGQVEQAHADEARQRKAAEAAKGEAEKAREELAVTSYFHNVGFALREAQDGNFIRAQQLLADCPEASRKWEWWHAYRNAHQEVGVGECALPAVDVAHPEPRKVVVALADGSVTTYEFAKGVGTTVPLSPHPDALVASRLSADGRRVLTVTRAPDVRVEVWDVASGKRLASWERVGPSPLGVGLSDDGRRAFVQFDDDVRCYDVDSGEESGRAATKRDGVQPRLAVSGDGSMVALLDDLKVGLWDGRAKELTDRLPAPEGRPTAAVVGPNRRVVIGTNTGALAFYSAEKKLVEKRPKAHAGSVNHIVFSPDGRRAATAGEDGAVRVWDTATGRLVKTFLGHHGKVLAVRFDLTGEKLVSSDKSLLFFTWGMDDGYQPRHTLVIPNAAGGLFAADREVSRVFAAGTHPSFGGTIHPRDRKPTTTVVGPKGQPLTAFGFSPAGPGFATGGGHGRVEWRDAPDAQPVRVGDVFALVDALRFTPDGTRLLAASGARWLVWDVNGKKTLLGRVALNQAVALSPDGLTVASAERNNLVLCPTDGRPPRTIECPGVITAVAFSPDGKRVLAALKNWVVHEYDAAAGTADPAKPLRTFSGHTARVNCVAFSSDGTRMASGSADGSVKVWDTKTGREAAGLTVGGRDAVLDVWFTGNGQRLIALPQDRPPVVFDGSPRYLAYKPR